MGQKENANSSAVTGREPNSSGVSETIVQAKYLQTWRETETMRTGTKEVKGEIGN